MKTLNALIVTIAPQLENHLRNIEEYVKNDLHWTNLKQFSWTSDYKKHPVMND